MVIWHTLTVKNKILFTMLKAVLLQSVNQSGIAYVAELL